MQLKVIKSDIEHEEAMNALMELMDANPEEGSPEANKLEVLATLIEKYEEERFPIDLPDAVEAIRFRMDQQGLTQKDLIPYIGTAARVSEILNRRRPLSLNMIRSLNEGLGIPAAVLIGKAEKLSTSDEYALEWDKFPLKEMHERGCFPSFTGKIADLKTYAEELVQGFLNLLPSRDTAMPALLRSNVHQRSGRPMDRLALYAWQVTVQQQALQQPHYHLYLGRKSCPLAAPVNPLILKATNFEHVLDHYSIDGCLFGLFKDSQPRYYWEQTAECETELKASYRVPRYDQPLSRARWQFVSREEHVLLAVGKS